MTNYEARQAAAAMARKQMEQGRNKIEALEAALRACPQLKLTVDQLGGLAFGATFQGFGRQI